MSKLGEESREEGLQCSNLTGVFDKPRANYEAKVQITSPIDMNVPGFIVEEIVEA